jgi:hypothetical protein
MSMNDDGLMTMHAYCVFESSIEIQQTKIAPLATQPATAPSEKKLREELAF